jgi:hypothetical protein
MVIVRIRSDRGYPIIGLLSSLNALALTTDSSDQISVHAQDLRNIKPPCRTRIYRSVSLLLMAQ